MALVQQGMSKFLYGGRVGLGELGSLSEGFEGGCRLSELCGVMERESGALGVGSDQLGIGVGSDQLGFGVGSDQLGFGGGLGSELSENVFLKAMDKPQPTQSSDSDCKELDPAVASPVFEAARRRRRSYEFNRHFQDSWAAKMPWAEPVMGNDGRVCQVRCKICSDVEGRDKLLVPKLDSLWKHAGRRKALVGFGKISKGSHYFLSTCQHVKNERIHFARGGSETIVQKVVEGAVREKKKKLVQFRTLFSVLSSGRPMADYESMQGLLMQLQVPDMPRKHWSGFCGWEMAVSMAAVLSAHAKKLIADAPFFSLSADEVTTIDHQSWLSLHIYIVVGFRRVPILLQLQRLVEGNGASAVLEAILIGLDYHGGLKVDKIAERCVSFGADGVSVFQGSRTGVTTQLKNKHAPYMLGVHCMAHRTNLAVQPISNLPLVAKLESLCKAMYAYFSASPKKHLEFQKLADLMETEGLKMLRNVKTRWISLLDPLRRVLGEYKTLIVKMCEDAALKEPDLTAKQAAARDSARLNCDLLCDIGTLLALPCIMPLLESVNCLMKFAQSTHVYVSDYVAAVKICQAELYMMYIDGDSSFQRQHFQQFVDVVEDHSYTISQEWVVDLNDGTETLSFRIGERTYSAHKLCLTSGQKLAVSRGDFDEVVSSVKGQCQDAAEVLISELEKRFPDSDLMNAFSVVFPQFWLQPNCDELFPLYMKTIRNHYCVAKSVDTGTEEEPVMVQYDAPLDARTLGIQTSLFKLTMKSNAKSAMAEPRDVNPMTKLWEKIGQNGLMLSRLSEFFKLSNIAICSVLGSVEDERTFSTLGFMKSKVRNRLGGHLDTCVKIFAQPWYNQETFPYTAAISHWSEARKRMGVEN